MLYPNSTVARVRLPSAIYNLSPQVNSQSPIPNITLERETPVNLQKVEVSKSKQLWSYGQEID